MLTTSANFYPCPTDRAELNAALTLVRKKADFAQRAVLWSNQPYPRRASEFSAVFEWWERQSGFW